ATALLRPCVCGRLVSRAKEAARGGNLEASLKLFSCAHELHPSDRLRARIQRLEEALAELALAPAQEPEEEERFVDVCGSGLLLFGELHDKLFVHQRQGVAFLYRLYREGRQGGILADDMGLGKTMQIIAFLSGMFDSELIQFVLLVVPTTLISSWLKEFARWTPGMRVKEFHGISKTERMRNLERIRRKTGVLITTYMMLINNWQQLCTADNSLVWDYVILDEAHKIKTPSTKTTKCVHLIPAKNRILLTGTPVQNNLREMWSLFDFACQGSLLGTVKTFKMEYENPITRAREKDATPGERALGLKISENLMSLIKPYFLRRTKEEIQKKHESDQQEIHFPEQKSENVAPVMPSLSRKNDFVVWVYLAPVQEEIYRNFLSLDQLKELLLTTRSPLSELTVLKKLCDHPRLLPARACTQLGLGDHYSEQDDENEEGIFSGGNKINHVSTEALIQESGKLVFLIGLLERLRKEGHKTLVFSQSRKMLDIIECILTQKRFKIMRLDGTVSHAAEREKRISMFQSNKDYSVFLLTTQVGGVGITLTAANRVVIFDPSWNPATDAQAVDRVYRIGQKENVVIYRLITCSTVEEKIYRRQVFKDSLIRQTTGDTKNPFRYFTKQELRELFTLENTRISATQVQLQSLHANQRKSDLNLDEHIAYLYSLEIFGISDHDLMYTQETAHEDHAENQEAYQYIQERVQKAQELVQSESQLKDRIGRLDTNIENAWSRLPELSSKPRKNSPELNNKNCFIPPPVLVDPPDHIDLTEDEAANNSRRTSLATEDLSEDKLAQEVSSIVINEVLTSSNVVEQSCVQESSEQKSDPSFVSYLADKESASFKSRECFSTSFTNLDCLNDVQMTSSLHSQQSLHESVFDCKKEREREKSLDLLADRSETSKLVLSVASDSFLVASAEPPNRLQQSHVSEISLQGMSVASFQNQVDFNLVLEESEHGQQDASGEVPDNTENTGSQYEVKSSHNFVTNFQEKECYNGTSYNITEDNLNYSLGGEASVESDNSIAIVKKKHARRLSSESEDENNSIEILDENMPPNTYFPINNSLYSSQVISASTPKLGVSLADALFSPRITGSGNKSTASKGSLLNMVLDQVEDVEETMGSSDDAEDSDEKEGYVLEEAEEHSTQSLEMEDEPAGETLNTEDSIDYLDDREEESQEESTDDPELLSGEQLDCFSHGSASQKEKIQSKLNVLSASDNYDTLVECGKKLKEDGKLQDALNCFLQALDIKKGDLEIMLTTLNLYKQLSQK
ncbi:PREDICTED: DNA excision repair protein ERCC-6-like, partial [Crocodylus porosus]|uniref:DNA excision repair protein ERCC-6-like n=1 Tax=Crocodylus porosus TaxID=8502 RepID=UPI00093AD037